MDEVPLYDSDELLDYNSALAKYGKVPGEGHGNYVTIKFIDLNTKKYESYIIRKSDDTEAVVYYKKYSYWWIEKEEEDYHNISYKWSTVIDNIMYDYSRTFSSDIGNDITYNEIIFQLLSQAKGYSFLDFITIMDNNTTKSARKA